MNRFALLLPVVFVVGCSSNTNSTDTGAATGPEAALREVGGLLQAASAGAAPKKASDLAPFENGYPVGYQAVQTGEVVVVWGAKVPGEGALASAPADVIAYEKKAPTSGGWVLLQNMTTKQMTAAEFAAAPKAK